VLQFVVIARVVAPVAGVNLCDASDKSVSTLPPLGRPFGRANRIEVRATPHQCSAMRNEQPLCGDQNRWRYVGRGSVSPLVPAKKRSLASTHLQRAASPACV
jgi:hypothetical protein